MVSPEGEQLELVETIDPKGQNVEAWLLELEGNMRLTVRVRCQKTNLYECASRDESEPPQRERLPSIVDIHARTRHSNEQFEIVWREFLGDDPGVLISGPGVHVACLMVRCNEVQF